MRTTSTLVRAVAMSRTTMFSTAASSRIGVSHSSKFVCRQCRAIQIAAKPTSETPRLGGLDGFGGGSGALRDVADAKFEVLGAPYSMLSVSLSASQRLFTRRGTLVAVSGKPENAQSTLSLLSPVPRAALGVPFLYQRITSTTPLTALIATKSPTTTFQVLHLDGTADWMVTQRNALLAWTGHTLGVTPRIQTRLPLAFWGSTELTGRGLVALSSPGQIYELTLGEGEEFVAHPGHVVAYAMGREKPTPFRFKSKAMINLQVPSFMTSWVDRVEWIKNLKASEAYKVVSRVMYTLRTMARRSIWGDRLFLKFQGPSRILMSSRGVRVVDSLSDGQVNEIMDSPAGAAEALARKKGETTGEMKEDVKKVGEVAKTKVVDAMAAGAGSVAEKIEEGRVKIAAENANVNVAGVGMGGNVVTKGEKK